MTPTEVALDATILRLKALVEADRQQIRRWGAYADMNADGQSHRQIQAVLEELLDKAATEGLAEELGMSHEEILRKAGVSHDSITLALSRLRA